MIFAMLRLLVAVVCVAGLFSARDAHAQEAPHAVHGARLGGSFAAAADDTVHVEVSWSEQRRVRLFVADASGAPIPIERLRDFEATATAAGIESRFTLLEVEGYFEARVPTLAQPASIAMRLRTGGGEAESFTFVFAEHSAAMPGSSSPVEVPPTVAGILDAVAHERRTMQQHLDGHTALEALGPEERIRELVLALEPHVETKPPAERLRTQAAISAAVRAGWLLHTAIDYGSVEQRTAALAALDQALRDVAAAAGGHQ